MKFKKGQVGIYLSLMVLIILTVLIAGVLAPMGVLFNTEMFAAGEDILRRGNSSLQKIENQAIKASLQDSLDASFSAAQNNIEVNNDIFRYGWVLAIGLGAIVAFLITRRNVEFGSFV